VIVTSLSMTVAATVVRGRNNGVITYAWSQVSGPTTPTISAPTDPLTQIEFSDWTVGNYVFQLVTTTESGFVVTNTATLTVPAPLAPVIESGSRQVTYAVSPSVLIAPSVVDDGHAGALTYTWTQLSGPATATITPSS